MASQKRLTKELGELTTSPPQGITVALTDDNNLFDWTVTIEGPSNSPYAGGVFTLKLEFPPEYPFKPPTVRFTTKIYHPNVSNDSPPNSGLMCLGILKPDDWKPSQKITQVLAFVQKLLVKPDADDPTEVKIGELFRTDRAAFDKEARDWTKRYAKK